MDGTVAIAVEAGTGTWVAEMEEAGVGALDLLLPLLLLLGCWNWMELTGKGSWAFNM